MKVNFVFSDSYLPSISFLTDFNFVLGDDETTFDAEAPCGSCKLGMAEVEAATFSKATVASGPTAVLFFTSADVFNCHLTNSTVRNLLKRSKYWEWSSTSLCPAPYKDRKEKERLK